MSKQKLGRGLSALMADINAGEPPAEKTQSARPAGVREIPIERLERNPAQPRRFFDKTKLAELTDSIRQKGILQPILVRPLPASYGAKGQKIEGRYQIVAGERRWHAAQAAGLEAMPALIRDLMDVEVLEIGVIENVQRTDLNPIEEARAYQSLMREFGRKQVEIAAATGKSRPHIANMLRLLSLPSLAQDYLADGKISAGHARAILAAPDPQALADEIVAQGLSVRAAELRARQATNAGARPEKSAKRDANVESLEYTVSRHLGMKVRIDHKSPGGKFTISYKTLDELDDIIKRLNGA